MAITTINRGKNVLPKLTRKQVTANQLFQYIDSKTGKAKGAVFAHFGHGDSLGKSFSIPLSGDKAQTLSGTPNNNPVVIVGSFELEAQFDKKPTPTRRDALVAGDVFQVPTSAHAKATGKPSLYVNLGRVNKDRQVLAYNLNTKTLAIGSKLNGKVLKVGDINLSPTISG